MTPNQAIQRREVFIAELAKTGLVATAARIAGLDRSELYKHRDRNPEFAERWAEAQDLYVDELEAEARRRAVAGTDKGVWHRVRVGPYTSVEELNRTRDTLRQNGIETALIKVRE